MPASYLESNTSGLRVQLRFTLASLFRQPISSSIFLFIFHLDKNKSLIQNSKNDFNQFPLELITVTVMGDQIRKNCSIKRY